MAVDQGLDVAPSGAAEQGAESGEAIIVTGESQLGFWKKWTIERETHGEGVLLCWAGT